MTMEDRILSTIMKYLIENEDVLSEEEKNDLVEQKNYMAKRIVNRNRILPYAIKH